MAYLYISFQFISNHNAIAWLDVEQFAGFKKDVLVWFLPGQVPWYQHAVEVLAKVQPFNLLPLSARRPVRDQTEKVILPVPHSSTSLSLFPAPDHAETQHMITQAKWSCTRRNIPQTVIHVTLINTVSCKSILWAEMIHDYILFHILFIFYDINHTWMSLISQLSAILTFWSNLHSTQCLCSRKITVFRCGIWCSV